MVHRTKIVYVIEKWPFQLKDYDYLYCIKMSKKTNENQTVPFRNRPVKDLVMTE